jgi:hypothetical protein
VAVRFTLQDTVKATGATPSPVQGRDRALSLGAFRKLVLAVEILETTATGGTLSVETAVDNEDDLYDDPVFVSGFSSAPLNATGTSLILVDAFGDHVRWSTSGWTTGSVTFRIVGIAKVPG